MLGSAVGDKGEETEDELMQDYLRCQVAQNCLGSGAGVIR
jgi:hypothetical protein